MIDYLPFIIFLMILAVFLGTESALTVIYMIVGIFLLGFWWNKRALRHVVVTRQYDTHAFIGEKTPITLVIKNNSILPILWVEVHESLAVDLRAGRVVKHVFSLGGHAEQQIQYELFPGKRGLYHIGPLMASTGDPLGLIHPTKKEFPSDSLTVYPQVVSLSAFGLSSRSPFGTIKHANPIYEDPSRILGKRDFQNGDSIRQIDWKSSASSGQLLVKLYEASIALNVVIILDLQRDSYTVKNYYKDTELAITAAASVAAWGNRHHQPVGLITNGIDPHYLNQIPVPIQPKKGPNHFIRILEVLARIQPGDQKVLETLIQDASTNLTWGSTIVLISGSLQNTTLNLLFDTKKKGIIPVMIFSGQSSDFRSFKQKADYYRIQLYKASFPNDLKTLGKT